MNFFEACERMGANGEFYTYPNIIFGKIEGYSIIRIENDMLMAWHNHDKKWVESSACLKYLCLQKYEKCENPEKPKDERPFRHNPDAKLIFDVHINTYSNVVGQHIEYDLVNEPEEAKKWGEAISTFLRLKSAEGAAGDLCENGAYICFVSPSALCVNSFKYIEKGNVYFNFQDEIFANKAIDLIGTQLICQMFKTFAGIE